MSAREDVLINVEKRLFYLSNDIDNETIGKLCFNLAYIIQEDDYNEQTQIGYVREPIKLFINSLGGSTYDMWALIDMMLNSKTPIYTYCTGYAMSSAFKIFLAGSRRFMSEHATLLYHQLSQYRSGKYQDLIERNEDMIRCQEKIEEYVMSRTKITKEKLLEIREKKIDWFIYAEDAIELGVATDIIEQG